MSDEITSLDHEPPQNFSSEECCENGQPDQRTHAESRREKERDVISQQTKLPSNDKSPDATQTERERDVISDPLEMPPEGEPNPTPDPDKARPEKERDVISEPLKAPPKPPTP